MIKAPLFASNLGTGMSDSRQLQSKHAWIVGVVRDLAMYARENNLNMTEELLNAAMVGVLFDLNLNDRTLVAASKLSYPQDQVDSSNIVRLLDNRLNSYTL